MRVLAVTHSLGSNGAALCLCRVLVAIKEAGGSADVVHGGDGGEFLVRQLREQGVGVLERADSGDYDVAIVNTLLDYRRVAEVADFLPVLFWVHEGSAVLGNNIDAAAGWMRSFQRSSRIVFDTVWQSQSVFASMLGHVEPHRVLHVDPGVAISPATGVEAGTGKSGHHIVTVGSVYPRKRPADIVEAVMRMADPRAHCTFIGNLEWLGLNGPSMTEIVRDNPLLFTLAGEIPEARKRQCLLDSDVFCSASGDETFGMAALEAASMGLPLAISDLPCYKGIWRHGVNALMAPVGAIDCLSWNLTALTRDRHLARRLGQAAMRTAARFTRDRFIRAMFDALKQAIEDPAQRA